jgi:hypothetical protein
MFNDGLNVTVFVKKTPDSGGEGRGKSETLKPHVLIASLSDALRSHTTANTVVEHSIGPKAEILSVMGSMWRKMALSET